MSANAAEYMLMCKRTGYALSRAPAFLTSSVFAHYKRASMTSGTVTVTVLKKNFYEVAILT